MKRLNKKGFTLIELLAVIIILGVLLMVAIPAMSGFIENAKKDAFISTAKNYISAARYATLQGDYNMPGVGQFNVIPISEIELEKGSKKSAYDKDWKTDASYVVILNDGTAGTNTIDAKDKFYYFFLGVDTDGNGIKLTEENSMKRSDVKKQGLKSVSEYIPINNLKNSTGGVPKGNFIIRNVTLTRTSYAYSG